MNSPYYPIGGNQLSIYLSLIDYRLSLSSFFHFRRKSFINPLLIRLADYLRAITGGYCRFSEFPRLIHFGVFVVTSPCKLIIYRDHYDQPKQKPVALTRAGS